MISIIKAAAVISVPDEELPPVTALICSDTLTTACKYERKKKVMPKIKEN